MKKGDKTKRKILDRAFELASKLGLEGLSIGTLAAATEMSKSGLFGHFQSKENLQVKVMEHAGDIFNEAVILPALKTKAGIPRIRMIMERWILWTKELSGGCIFVSAAAEYSDRPGPVRDFILEQQDAWIDSLARIARSAVSVEDFRPDTNCDLFAYELYSLILGFYLYHSSLKHPDVDDLMSESFDRLIHSYQSE